MTLPSQPVDGRAIATGAMTAVALEDSEPARPLQGTKIDHPAQNLDVLAQLHRWNGIDVLARNERQALPDKADPPVEIRLPNNVKHLF
jgi:hypothetical protein